MFGRAWLLAGLVLLAGSAHAQSLRRTTPANPSEAEAIRSFLLNYLGHNSDFADYVAGVDRDESLDFGYAHADLSAAIENEIFVAMRGRGFCGNVMCVGFILQPGKCGFRVVDALSVHEPIYVLPSINQGWRDVSIRAHGSAEHNPDLLHRFDGEAYRSRTELARIPEGAIETPLGNFIPLFKPVPKAGKPRRNRSCPQGPVS